MAWELILLNESTTKMITDTVNPTTLGAFYIGASSNLENIKFALETDLIDNLNANKLW